MKTAINTRILLAVLALGLSASLGFSCGDQSPDSSSVPREVQESLAMQRWYMFYLSVAESGPTPVITPSDGYTSAFDAPGQDDFVKSEYKRMLALLPSARTRNPPEPSVSSGACNNEVIILVQNHPASSTNPANICLSTFLIHRLFVKSSDPELLVLHSTLQSWGLDPQRFDGSFNAGIARRQGKTVADWNAILGGGSRYWDSFAGSVDFILARQMVRSAGDPASSTQTEQSRNAAAKQLVLKVNGKFDISSLISALEDSARGFGTAAWGYETQGDFATVDAAFRSL